MDRLPSVNPVHPFNPSTLAVAVLMSFGCGDQAGSTSSAALPPPGRVNAVKADPSKQTALEEYCEVRANPAQAKPFVYPELANGVGPNTTRWTWVNVWATWCKPCVAELPMLARWAKRFGDEKVDVDMVYLSVDATASDVDGFKRAHPGTPDSLQIRDTNLLGAWLTTIGLDASAVLPVHLFVDPERKIRCVRMGGVSESDYGTIKRVLAGE